MRLVNECYFLWEKSFFSLIKKPNEKKNTLSSPSINYFAKSIVEKKKQIFNRKKFKCVSSEREIKIIEEEKNRTYLNA